MNRRKSREETMKLAYQMSINQEKYYEVISKYKQNSQSDLKDIDFDYMERILKGIQNNLEKIDNKIRKYSKKWDITRISKTNLAILRIAIYEIMYEDDIPTKVSLNEAIELSKIYSEDKSSAFINGVLSNFV